MLRLTHCQLRPTNHRVVISSPGTSGRPSVASGVGSRSRKALVLYAKGTDGAGMSADDVQKAMDTQLRQASLAAREWEKNNMDSTEDQSPDAGREVQKRVVQATGTLDDDQVARAIQRQVGATHADWSHDEEDEEDAIDEADEKETTQSDAVSEQPTEDESISFTAEELQAVSYDEIKGIV